MLTRCPQCATIYRVTPEQLKVRRGKVRCGKCQTVFNALESLDDEPQTVWGTQSVRTKKAPPEAPAAAPRPATPQAASAPITKPADVEITLPPEKLVFPALSLGVHPAKPIPEPQPKPEPRSEPRPEPLPEPRQATPSPRPLPPSEPEPLPEPQPEAPATEPPVTEPPLEAAAAIPHTLPKPERKPEPKPDPVPLPEPEILLQESDVPERRWPWRLASTLALLLLVLQAILHFRTELAVALPEARPALVALCQVLDCQVALPSEINWIGIETSDLAPDPNNAHHLQLAATLKNRAPFAQTWPHLEVTLTDTSDRAIVRRALAPAEYLPAKLATSAEGFPPRAEQAVELGLRTVELPAAGYRLYVFYP